jgi:hypothetical protein
LHVDAARRNANNPYVVCAQKIDRTKTALSPDMMNFARSVCLKNPQSFDWQMFLNNNSQAICEGKIRETIITNVLHQRISPTVQNIATRECLTDAHKFEGQRFLKTNKTAVCERRVGRLRDAGLRQSLLDLAVAKCDKVGLEFKGDTFEANFNYCDTIAKNMTSLWAGFRRKARAECALKVDPEKDFSETDFIRDNLLPPPPKVNAQAASSETNLD